MITMDATYDPADNKLRLRASSRLDAETYARVHAAGFIWAPKQDLFVAPKWTPEREDLLLELCGDIGDEDTSLVERAEERAGRFDDYRVKRAADADQAHKAVARIADGIPLGQPILVGHHSERHARKDAERIENGMRKAVKMWETSNYWAARAAGAIRHAKYLERPDVRFRRIKGLESDKRKCEKHIKQAEVFVKLWSADGLTLDKAKAIANYDHVSVQVEGQSYRSSTWSQLEDGKMTAEEAKELSLRTHARIIAVNQRWLTHIDNRLAYERAMLSDGGGLATDGLDIQVGGQVLVRGEWLTVLKVNRTGGRIGSVRTNSRYVSVKGIEEVKEYRAPAPEEAAKLKAALAAPPICNYPGPGFHHMTKAEWAKMYRDYKGTRELGVGSERMRGGSGRMDVKTEEAPAPVGRHRVRTCVIRSALVPVYLTDAKRTDPPAALLQPEDVPAIPLPARVLPAARPAAPAQVTDAAPFEAMKAQLKAGVQVVSAPQLFPTPRPLAMEMARAADLRAGNRVLEPSAGTGVLIEAILDVSPTAQITAVEINGQLAAALDRRPAVFVHRGDFLECTTETIGKFDRILMNPPFERGSDVKHIEHALSLLAPGGRLVAICADGPRQKAALQPWVTACGGLWGQQESGTFDGTGVRTVMLTITVPAAVEDVVAGPTDGLDGSAA